MKNNREEQQIRVALLLAELRIDLEDLDAYRIIQEAILNEMEGVEIEIEESFDPKVQNTISRAMNRKDTIAKKIFGRKYKKITAAQFIKGAAGYLKNQ